MNYNKLNDMEWVVQLIMFLTKVTLHLNKLNKKIARTWEDNRCCVHQVFYSTDDYDKKRSIFGSQSLRVVSSGLNYQRLK